ncbi:unnamed protein product [[Candida] boidinii]|nr:unnamed protein product [[Candida] boidinii]
MLDKQLTMSQVSGKIIEQFNDSLFVIWSEDNAEKLVIRCRLLHMDKSMDEELEDSEDGLLKTLEAEMLENITLRGIDGISRVFMMQYDRTYVDGEGDFSKEKEWVLETDGINLADVITVDGIDTTLHYTRKFLMLLLLMVHTLTTVIWPY